MQTSNVFSRNLDAVVCYRPPRFVVNKGGTRSGKTYSILQLWYLMVAADTGPTINSVVSETLPHLKRGAIRDFQQILSAENLWSDHHWNKTDSIYTFPHNSAVIEFFGAESPDKVHGPSRDRLFLNEAQNIAYDVARHLFVRTRGQVFIDYNPTGEFWVDQHVIGSGRERLIHSTYLDNRFLSAEQVAEIESNRRDENWWRVYGLGETGRLEGVIYDFRQVDAIPVEITNFLYGLDFGFTNDPNAIVRIALQGDDLWLDEVCYQKGLLNSDIAAILAGADVRKRSDDIYADSADPKSIEELYRYGYNVKPAPKGPDSILAGIHCVKRFNLHVTARSVNLIRELRNYKWDTDKHGVALNKPVDVWNHALDAVRYAVFSTASKPKTKATFHFASRP